MENLAQEDASHPSHLVGLARRETGTFSQEKSDRYLTQTRMTADRLDLQLTGHAEILVMFAVQEQVLARIRLPKATVTETIW